MFRLLLSVIFAALLAVSCSKPKEFTVEGTLSDGSTINMRAIYIDNGHLENSVFPTDKGSFTLRGSSADGTIVELLDKGAVVALPYGVEGFATPKHLVKEDGTTATVDEKLPFKVIEFNKETKRIILSHSRIFEDEARAEASTERKPKRQPRKAEAEAPVAAPAIEKATLGDLEALAALKEKLSGK